MCFGEALDDRIHITSSFKYPDVLDSNLQVVSERVSSSVKPSKNWSEINTLTTPKAHSDRYTIPHLEPYDDPLTQFYQKFLDADAADNVVYIHGLKFPELRYVKPT